MKFTSFLSAVSATLGAVSLVSAAALDVYSPKVTSPKLADIWVSGTQADVTWDTSDAPKHITNSKGYVYLRKDGSTDPTALAEGFNITDGSVSVTVPEVDMGSYQIVLMGDSGNFSPEFTIVPN
ncbi:hypothetical protein CYLTODRAFT_342821 [Cylindrobasidium torrendii FP15055 ss-10]|uniref:Yeast cell wall synthesis Kre9/Knh1-like N-terminal domain-containing protein n=1 Tax=Cylindrobasidium torrendii FP15055 ss-10 TaxID=1314674 RepID=A0A0D7BSA3_9AGAR|nr:hypothetical protein CYLTODRAFT_342821 [Cylindrobasidium torrendii FP15055 ss-10]